MILGALCSMSPEEFHRVRPRSDYDVSADGQRFVMFPASDTESTNRGIVTLVTPWFDELTRTFTTSR